MTTTTITQAVIPAAGLGSRFLPITKTVPKELIPLLDLPCLWIVMTEAIQSGIRDFVIITSEQKPLLQEFFKTNTYLNHWLEKRGQHEQLNWLKQLENDIKVTFVNQNDPLGLGHAVLCAETAITTDTFAVLLPDDIILSTTPVCQQLMTVHAQHQLPVVAVMEVDWAEIHRYGVVKAEPLSHALSKMSLIVEKPLRAVAPSNLAVVGRYLLPRSIFNILKKTNPGTGGEIQLTDALAVLVNEQGMLSFGFEGERHDTGNPLGLLKASLSYGLTRAEYKAELASYIKMLASVV